MKVLALLGVFAIIYVNGNRLECRHDSFKTCFAGIPSNFFALNASSITTEALDTGCALLTETEECVVKFIEQCHKDISNMWKATAAGMQFLCQQPRQGMLATIQCTLQDKASLQQCVQKTIMASSRYLRTQHPGTISQRKQDMCNSMKNVESCMVNVEKHDCGEKAAVIFSGYLDRIRGVMEAAMGCNKLDKPSPLAKGSPKCGPEKFLGCFSGFMTNDQFVPFGQFTKDVLDKNCKLFEETKGCVWEFEKECQPTISNVWNSLRNAFHYICTRPRQEMAKYGKCQNVHQNYVASCVERAMQVHAQLLHKDGRTAPNSQCDFCESVVTMENCVIKVEGDNCGENARRIYEGFFSRINKPCKKMCSMQKEPVKCTPKEYRKCFSNLLTKGEISFSQVTAQKLDLLCREFEKSRSCVRDFESHCHKKVTDLWRSMRNTFQFMCTHKRTAMIKFAQCNLKHQQNLMHCVRKVITHHTETLMRKHASVMDDRTRGTVCKKLTELEDCVGKVEDHPCGNGARGLFSEFYSRTTMNLLNSRFCQTAVMKSFCPDKFKQCFRDSSPIMYLFNQKKYSPTDIREYCRGVETARVCVNKFSQYCHADIATFWKAISAGINYLCSQDSNEISRSVNCLKEHNPQFHRCMMSSLMVQRNVLHHGHIGSSRERMRDMCKSVKAIETCVLETEGTQCGARATDVFRKMFLAMNVVLDTKKHCPAPMGIKDVHEDLGCHQSAMRQCLPKTDLVNKGKVTNNGLAKFCSVMEKMKKCVRQFASRCSRPINDYLHAHMSGVRRICRTDKSATISSLNCLSKHKSILGRCVKGNLEKHQHFLSHKNRHTSYAQTKDAICRSVIENEECLMKIGKQLCKEDRVKVMKEYLTSFNRKMKYYCQDHRRIIIDRFPAPNRSHHKRKIAIAVGIGAGAIILLATIIAICCRRHRRRRNRSIEKKFLVDVDQMPSNLSMVLEKNEKIFTIAKN